MIFDVSEQVAQDEEHGIAVIGMACTFPGADNPEQYWQNIIYSTDFPRTWIFLVRRRWVKCG